MKSPLFFSKGRTVRFWIQMVLVSALVRIAVVPSALYANPTGEQVVGGAAGFNRPDAATLIVNQNTDRAVINWNSFSIANGELTKFVQPNSSSAVLNRVVTANPSAIYGTLQANGNVFLINPGGVLVGAGGVVNTASFVASTHDINTEEFMKGGQLNFNGNSDAAVINQGNITAREGDVFLIAKEVKNEGQLMAKDGTVGMVSGTEVSLQAVGQGNYKVRLMAAETDPSSPRTSQSEAGASKDSAEIVNEGVIQAANAVLEAKGSYLPMAIKNTGVIEATGLVENGDGSVTLTGGEGDILNTGVVAALQRSLDGQKETGGSIMMTARNVTSDLGSVITAAGRDGGGTVQLRSGYTTELRGEISVVGASESAKGGVVQLLGERVGLLDQAKVDASGGSGGGEVLVGGDYLGKNPNVPNANAVVLAPDGKILADATSNGDGGKVILWSDEYTGFYGNISARGGMFTGDGGFVETSSKINLQAFGLGNVGSVSGTPGNWLLDPADVTIVATGGSGMSNQGPNPGGVGATTPTGNIYYPLVDSATINAGTITGLLSSGNVAVTTDNTDLTLFPPLTQAGSITLDPGVTVSWGSGTTLRLRATTDLFLYGTISGGADGALELFSDLGGTANQGQNGVISVGSILLNNISNSGGTSILNGNNVVDNIAAITLAGSVSFRDNGGFNGATGLVISTVTVGAVDGYTGGTDTGTTIPGTTGIGITSSGTINLTSVGPITQTAKIDMAGGSFCAVTTSGTIGSSIGADILLTNIDNRVANLNLATLDSGTFTTGVLGVTYQANAANIRFTEFQDFVVSNFGSVVVSNDQDLTGLVPLNGFNTADGSVAPAGGIITGRSIAIGADFFGGSIVLTAGADTETFGGTVTQTATGSIIGSNLGLLGDYNYDLTDLTTPADNNISTLAAFLEDGSDLSYTDIDGFQVAFVDFMRNTDTAVMIPGIQLQGRGIEGTDQFLPGNLSLTTLAGVEFSGIQLTSTGTVVTPLGTTTFASIKPANQYDLLTTFTGRLSPGHIEASGDVSIIVEDGDGVGGTTEANRFTLQEGIHLFAGMGPDLTVFGNRGSVTIQADNMIIGSDTRPDLAMHGLIMTGNVNEATTIFYTSSTALLPFTVQRQAFIVTTKADYDVTPDPGQLQLSQAELRRINTSRLQIDSGYTSATDFAVDVRTPLNLYGLYDTVEVSGIFPTNPGVNRLELIAYGGDAGGGARGNVQVSGGISSDVNQLPMDIFLSASAVDQSSGGFVNVNGGLRSYGGQIGLQGQNVNINSAVNANNPNQADGLGLVAIFPGQGPTAANPGTGVTPISLGTKVDENTLGILRTELALITAGTVQIGDVELRPEVLEPVNPFTRSSITGTNPLWKNFIQANDAGPITVTDLISNLSFNTLALVTSGDRTNPTNYALSQASEAGIQVGGLFVVGNPFAATTDYVLGGAFNEIDYLAVALGLDTASGAPSGDLLLVNQKGLVGGNGGEVARIQQQWDQNYTRTTTAPFLSTGVGLVVARALSITASGSVSIYETVPTGVTGLGYIGHVASNPNALANGSNGYAQVGNQIGLVGDSTSGLAINVIQNAVGETGANTVWAAAARGLSVNDLTTQFVPGLPPIFAEAGILTNGGQVTLEGNAIEIATSVDRGVGGNTITIDTTGASTSDSASAVAPSGARVVIRPATGQNGFQNRAGSGAFDPNLQNSPLAGAPVEMNLGTTSEQAGDSVPDFTPTFLNASLDTIFMGSSTMEGGAIRANVLEIGRNVDSGTASGKISITADIGSANNWMSTLLEALHVISGGPVEDSGMMVTGGTPNTITMNLNGEYEVNLDDPQPGSGLGGLAVDSLGAVAVQADVSLVAIDAGANNNVRFIDTAGGVTIGVVDGVSGVLANTFYVNATDPDPDSPAKIGQASGATIQATGGGVSLRSTGSIRLDQVNDFNLVAAYANSGTANQPIYLRTSGPMSVSIFGSGQPGGQPAGVAGITGSNVTLVTGGDLQQSDLAQITASDSFLATVLDGSDVLLNSTLNDLGDSPVIAALKADGTLGNIANLTLVNNGAFDLGSAGVLTADLAAAGSGWTQAPTVAVSGSLGASVSAVMGLNTVAVSSGGSGYQSAPLVTLTEAGVGTGVGASAVAIVDSNPLSSTYGQVTSINITNAGTGYTGTVTATLSGGGATQEATPGTVTLAIQRLNVENPGSGYTSTPTVTISAQSGSAGSGATATAVIGGTGGYVSSGSTTVLGGITGDLDISTAAGDITDGSGLSVAGTSTLNSTAGSIILDSMNNNLVGAIQATSSIDTTIKNANSLVLGNFNVGGNLELGSQGNIYQVSTGSALVVGGTSQFYATTTAASGGTPSGVVTLNNSRNDFGGLITAEGTRITIRNTGNLDLGAMVASQSLTASAAADSLGLGSITMAGFSGTGSLALNAAQDVTLTGNVSLTGPLSVVGGGDVTLRGVTVSGTGSSVVTAGGTITQAGGTSLTVAGAATFTSTGGGAITLVGNGLNDFQSTVALNQTTGAITLTDQNGLTLASSTLGSGAVNLTAVGITQASGTTLTASGIVTLNAGAGALTLVGAGNNNFTGTVNLTGGTTQVTDGVGGLTLGTLSTGALTAIANASLLGTPGTLNLGTGTISGVLSATSNGGAITQGTGVSDALTVTGISTIDAGAGTITLTQTGNDFQDAVSLTNSGGNAIQVTDATNLILGTVTAAGGGAVTISFGRTGTAGLSQNGVLTSGNLTLLANTAGAGLSNIDLSTQGNVISGTITIDNTGVAGARIGDFKLRNTYVPAPSGTALSPIGNLTSAVLPNLQNLTIIYNGTGYTGGYVIPALSAASMSIQTGGNITQGGILAVAGAATFQTANANITLALNNQFSDLVNLTTTGTGAVSLLNAGNLTLGTVSMGSGNLTVSTLAANGNITQTGSLVLTGNASFAAGTGDITLANSANDFANILVSSGDDVTLVDQTGLSFSPDGSTITGTLSIKAGGDVLWDNTVNSADTVTIQSTGDVGVILAGGDGAVLGSIQAAGTFALASVDNIYLYRGGAGVGDVDITLDQLQNISAGSFVVASESNINLGTFSSFPGIRSVELLAEGDINGDGVIGVNGLSIAAGGSATFTALNQISSLGSVDVGVGGFSFRNGQGLSISAPINVTGGVDLRVAGQFYNQSGSAQPFGGTTGGVTVRSLSLAGGLPNLISGLAGFSVGYNGQNPGGNRAMIYAVTPLTMFAPSGTFIAGIPEVDLGGTQTGGGQLNTFFTGSDNLNWMISDFGRFEMPTVKPSGMDYILYPQRVEPETKTLPAATLGQLERELGRPPTLEEIQAREVAVREAAMVRSGAILERTSFDAIEDEVDKQESAEVPAQVIDGGKPQADARGQRSEDGMQKAEVGSRPSFAPSPASAGGASQGFGSQARKTQSVRQGSNGPILRSGPIRSVAQLRPAEPAEGARPEMITTQTVHLDAKSVIEQERASAEVGIAPPIASGR
jgi:filamentous hemagglutinin family protein